MVKPALKAEYARVGLPARLNPNVKSKPVWTNLLPLISVTLKPSALPTRSVTTIVPNEAWGVAPPPHVPVQWSEVRRNVSVSPSAALASDDTAINEVPTAAAMADFLNFM